MAFKNTPTTQCHVQVDIYVCIKKKKKGIMNPSELWTVKFW